MLDARFVRENINAVKEALEQEGIRIDLSHFLAMDEKRIHCSERLRS